MSDAATGAVLDRMGRDDIVPHGFRSTFRDWAAERGYPDAVAEAALAHSVPDAVVAAYKNTRIAYGAVEMDRLTAEEWKIVNQIKAERDKAKGKTAYAYEKEGAEEKVSAPLELDLYDVNGRGWPGISGLEDLGVKGEITGEGRQRDNDRRPPKNRRYDQDESHHRSRIKKL